MAFISSSSFDATNDVRSIARRASTTLGLAKQTKLTYGTPSISMQGRELINIMERFINGAIDDIEDPAFDFIQMHIDWTDKDGLFGFPSLENTNCAWAYLTRIGETKRADMLLQCIDILKTLFDNYTTVDGNKRGYYLRSVDGLGSLNENRRKLGVPFELSLTLSDDVCWRIRSVCNMLEDIFYDRFRQLEVLPVNLRRFNATLIIKDCRDLHTYLTSEAMQRVAQATTEEARQQAMLEMTVADHLFMSDTADTKYFPDQLQSMVIKLVCCEFVTKALPDSVNNTEQSEVTQSIQLTALGYDKMLLAPAIDAILTSSEDLAKSVDTKDVSAFAKVMAKAKASLKAQAAATLASYTNASYNLSKSMLSNLAYDKLEESGTLDLLNKAKSLLSGDIVGAQLSKALAERMANEVMHSTYFKEQRMLDTANASNTASAYFHDKRALDNE